MQTFVLAKLATSSIRVKRLTNQNDVWLSENFVRCEHRTVTVSPVSAKMSTSYAVVTNDTDISIFFYLRL